jgi:2-oxoglutarate ferredoxin oxidoreductase subunit beta
MKPGALKLEVVQLGLDGISESDILVHDETDHIMAGMLAGMHNPDFPVAVGVLYCEPAQAYDAAVHEQINAAVIAKDGQSDMNSLLRSGSTWNVV